MLIRRIALVVLPAASLALAGCQVASTAQPKSPSLGYLEHRGRTHELRDLMDPAYRAASDDRFAREFEPGTHFAADVDEQQ